MATFFSGFVLMDEHVSEMDVLKHIDKALTFLVRNKMQENKSLREKFKCQPDWRVSPQSYYFNVDFVVGDEQRSLGVCFRNTDHQDVVNGLKISYLLQDWGAGREIIKHVSEHLADWGYKVWHQTGFDTDFVKAGEQQ